VPPCKYHEICGQDVEGNSAEGLCILHSTDPAKDTHAFAEAVAAHRERNGDNFSRFVFPEMLDFRMAAFNKGVNFDSATFGNEVNFNGARFDAKANFKGASFDVGVNFNSARFSAEANFTAARFNGVASFTAATFSARVFFLLARFSGRAYFSSAKFYGVASFSAATFGTGASFSGAQFPEKANFRWATFLGRTLFDGREGGPQTGYIFTGAEVDFREVMTDSADAIAFQEADLTKCQFQGTDLRKVQLVGIKWPRKGWRTVVYDDIAPIIAADGNARPWSQLERLYRELKQNYEDRRDYERAGDFHYGEKEMRRQNPNTAWGLRFFLTLYWLFSGYGERYLRPLLWAGLLCVGSTIGYMWWGLRFKDGSSGLAWTYPWINPWDWLRAAYYSFRVMTLLKPDDWVPLRYAQLVNTFQTLFGPIFLGLFALALRQRLKR
jgi:uncharacterized protein YjbI with pentapeptide repeats